MIEIGNDAHGKSEDNILTAPNRGDITSVLKVIPEGFEESGHNEESDFNSS
eukprot:CAMPEP_0114592100 /NCGR_PEP_ID=MMETSP0125-20121206/14011_1 /TAXON_ID=485358 ORGANISM="Aristerostoma sp., Strain ATCC 50986" /NCGR_SAMPLE_ID=MMETSP0125 /ASSEMBLY_ACC=CAM_ASM_000245 /LENGTH=50 /DNA_ID=CAMNT_0001790575 /DNA_START=147 /DNA_END=299 /DNA_ORIENTATION=+